MKKKKCLWGGLLNKERFKWMEEERDEQLQNLTIKESIRMTEYLLSSNLFSKFRNSFQPDNPLCLKLGLKLRRKNVTECI